MSLPVPGPTPLSHMQSMCCRAMDGADRLGRSDERRAISSRGVFGRIGTQPRNEKHGILRAKTRWTNDPSASCQSDGEHGHQSADEPTRREARDVPTWSGSNRMAPSKDRMHRSKVKATSTKCLQGKAVHTCCPGYLGPKEAGGRSMKGRDDQPMPVRCCARGLCWRFYWVCGTISGRRTLRVRPFPASLV